MSAVSEPSSGFYFEWSFPNNRMKKLILSLIVLIALVFTGCVAPHVPETVIKTPFGEFRGPKDMIIEGLQYQRMTNGSIVLTAKSIKSHNNPDVLEANSGQIEAHWKGVTQLSERLIAGAAAGAAKGVKPTP